VGRRRLLPPRLVTLLLRLQDPRELVDLSDPISLLEFLFLGGPSPPDPFGSCGHDPAGEALGCTSFPACADRCGI
jgi:hypothetical protein